MAPAPPVTMTFCPQSAYGRLETPRSNGIENYGDFEFGRSRGAVRRPPPVPQCSPGRLHEADRSRMRSPCALRPAIPATAPPAANRFGTEYRLVAAPAPANLREAPLRTEQRRYYTGLPIGGNRALLRNLCDQRDLGVSPFAARLYELSVAASCR